MERDRKLHSPGWKVNYTNQRSDDPLVWPSNGAVSKQFSIRDLQKLTNLNMSEQQSFACLNHKLMKNSHQEFSNKSRTLVLFCK